MTRSTDAEPRAPGAHHRPHTGGRITRRWRTATLTLGICGAVALTATPAALADTQTYTTPGEHMFTVPAGVTSLTVDAIGAQGGTTFDGGYGGGHGADVTGTLTVLPGETLYIEVGGRGVAFPIGGCPNGGSNGGGNSGGCGGGSAGGGGASDIRLDSNATPLTTDDTRLLVAAGGGGASNSYVAGGNAGQQGSYSQFGAGGGAPLTGGGLGGFSYSGCPSGTDGGLGLGGAGSSCGGGGGGGGYYGGGGGGAAAGGGGGSSYIAPAVTNAHIGTAQSTGNGQVTITYTTTTCTGGLTLTNALDPGSATTGKPGDPGTWTFDVTAQNCTGAPLSNLKLQGGTGGWLTVNSATGDPSGMTVTKNPKNNNTTITGSLDSFADQESATIAVTVSGTISNHAACGSQVPISGSWSASTLADDGSTVKSPYTDPVTITVTC
jgi:hypothetical protein